MAAQGQDTQLRLQSSEDEQRRRDEVVRHLKAKVRAGGARARCWRRRCRLRSRSLRVSRSFAHTLGCERRRAVASRG